MSATLGNGNITFGDGTSQSTAAGRIGRGQTWQDVTASRALNTTYTNSTGKPIVVSINWSSPISGDAYLYVGSSSTLASHVVQDRYPRFQLYAIVPPGYTYISQQSGGTFYKWFELR